MAISFAPTPEPFDDSEIADNDILIRRVNPEHHFTLDKNSGKIRLSTKAFSASSPALGGGMSVDIASKILDAGHQLVEFVTTPTYIASVQFKASAARGVGLLVGSSPTDDNPHHGEVWNADKKRFKKNQQRALLNACKWLHKPEELDVDIT